MYDQSPSSIEERLVALVWMHKLHWTKQKFPNIRHAFLEHFGKEAQTPRILREWEDKAFTIGCVLDVPKK